MALLNSVTIAHLVAVSSPGAMIHSDARMRPVAAARLEVEGHHVVEVTPVVAGHPVAEARPEVVEHPVGVVCP